jgi:deazaflavin-dependent oxidoreductase (nitroreductase family)
MPPLMRRIFWFLNKFFMVPMFRLGFGAIFVNPITGYIMVLKAVGRKSGKVRYAPVNYAIYKGDIYCVSGGRQTSDWYKNLLATPEIEVILPGGALYVRAEETLDVETRRVVIRQIFKNAGFAGFFEGYNPFTITDDELMQKSADLPLLRLHPLGLGSGAFDSGGWTWISTLVISIIVIILLIVKL